MHPFNIPNSPRVQTVGHDAHTVGIGAWRVETLHTAHLTEGVFRAVRVERVSGEEVLSYGRVKSHLLPKLKSSLKIGVKDTLNHTFLNVSFLNSYFLDFYLS